MLMQFLSRYRLATLEEFIAASHSDGLYWQRAVELAGSTIANMLHSEGMHHVRGDGIPSLEIDASYELLKRYGTEEDRATIFWCLFLLARKWWEAEDNTPRADNEMGIPDGQLAITMQRCSMLRRGLQVVDCLGDRAVKDHKFSVYFDNRFL